MPNGFIRVTTPNGVGGAIGKNEAGEILVRHPKVSCPGYDLDKFDRTECAHLASVTGLNGWQAWYRSEDVKEIVR